MHTHIHTSTHTHIYTHTYTSLVHLTHSGHILWFIVIDQTLDIYFHYIYRQKSSLSSPSPSESLVPQSTLVEDKADKAGREEGCL